MVPDLETYAPFIEAVFSVSDGDPGMVPFSIADRGVNAESRPISAFLDLLKLPLSRFGAGRVMEILESEEIREKFSLTEPDVETIREWVRNARVRWGIDGEYRQEIGMPGFTQNTWRTGLDRMLLGYAIPEKDGELFGGTLPFDGIEGGNSEILGRFLVFTEKLFSAASAMKQERTLNEWSGFLSGIIDDFFPVRDYIAADLKFLREAVYELRRFGESLDRKVELNVIREHLTTRLEKDGFGGTFLSGGMTFCAMLPMRSIPFKVICLLGMDDGSFPRESTAPGFDLMAKEPRPGDRSRRLDDRYLFLETILSARDKLYISYVGQDIRDNSTRPPSVLVSELLDYLNSVHGVADVTVRHALQAFNPRYFSKNGSLFSYSRENFAAARGLSGARFVPCFFTSGLSEPGGEFRNITLDGLCGFFSNPSRYLLTNRLGLHFEENSDILEDCEPFTIMGIDRYELENDLLRKALQGRYIRATELGRLKAGGLIPPGAPGECYFEETCCSIERLAKRILSLRAGSALEPLIIELSISGFNLTGTIAGLYPGGFIHQHPRHRKRELIIFWIMHLALACTLKKIQSPKKIRSVFCTADVECIYECPEQSFEILGELLNVYWQGLRKPIPFFPQASWAYAEARSKGLDSAEEKAREKWDGSDFARGEIEDPYFSRCFSGYNPLGGLEFREMALKIIGPALKYGEFKDQA